MESGYDCPAYSDFLETKYSMGEDKNRTRNAICLFECASDVLLQRHTTPFYFSNPKNSYLFLRTTAVIGNYDYTIHCLLYLDGSMEVKLRASGFIQGVYYVFDQSNGHEYRVHHQFASRMHEHVLNFTAGSDVLGPFQYAD